MPKSPAFIRIKRDVLAIAGAVPPGRVTTFQAIGEHLDVMPRHVAYILATLSEEEQMEIPWFRVVAKGGDLGVPKGIQYGPSQAELLKGDGVRVAGNKVEDFDRIFLEVEALDSGVPKQTRPADAPTPGT